MVLPDERAAPSAEPVPPPRERRESQNLMARGGRCGSPGGIVNPSTASAFWLHGATGCFGTKRLRWLISEAGRPGLRSCLHSSFARTYGPILTGPTGLREHIGAPIWGTSRRARLFAREGSSAHFARRAVARTDGVSHESKTLRRSAQGRSGPAQGMERGCGPRRHHQEI